MGRRKGEGQMNGLLEKKISDYPKQNLHTRLPLERKESPNQPKWNSESESILKGKFLSPTPKSVGNDNLF